MKHLEFNGFPSEHQFGFRPNRSMELVVTFFTDLIRRAANGGKATGAIFIDLSKAFDTISHSVLLEKLSRYGIQDNELTGLWTIYSSESRSFNLREFCQNRTLLSQVFPKEVFSSRYCFYFILMTSTSRFVIVRSSPTQKAK